MDGVADQIIDSYPPTPIQLGMLFESLSEASQAQKEHSPGYYLIQSVMRLQENLDTAVLWRAFERVVSRHSILRTRFRWEGLESPLQEVLAHVDLPVYEEDIRHLTLVEQNERLNHFLNQDRQRGIDLSQAPLFRLALLRLGEQDYRLIYTVHHIITDDYSSLRRQEELFQFYEAFRLGSDLELPEPVPYRAYVDWLQTWMQSEAFRKAESYWRNRLAGLQAATSLGLRSSLAKLPMGTQQYGSCSLTLPDGLRTGLLTLAQEHDLTLNTLFQGALALLLSRHSQEQEVIFGATRHCRRSVLDGQTSVLLGPILNTLPIRVQVDGRQNLLPWLMALRQQWVEMRSFENTPLTNLATWSNVPTGQPLFKSFCNFTYQSDTAALRGLNAGWQNRSVELFQAAPYELVAAMRGSPECQIELAYERSLFDDPSAERLLEQFHNILREMVTDPQRRLGQLSLLSQADKRHILVDWNATRQDNPSEQCVQQLFEAQVEHTPGNVAVVGGWRGRQAQSRDGLKAQELHRQGVRYRGLSYRSLNSYANQLAHFLHQQGVGPEVVVGVCLQRSVELAVALLGVLKAGGVYLPLNPEHPIERLRFIIQDSRPQIILTQHHLLNHLPVEEISTLCLDTDWSQLVNENPDNPANLNDPTSLAYIIYTSGSTGAPKGVMVSHKALTNFIYGKISSYPMGPTDRLLAQIPISFDPSLWELLIPWCCGSTVVLAAPGSEGDTSYLLQMVQDWQVTILHLVTSRLALCLENPGFKDCTSLRRIFCGGESMPPDLPERLQQSLQLEVLNSYGPTETCISATTSQLKLEEAKQPTPIGRPNANLQIYILDPELQPVPEGVAAEIYIGGDGLARGYLNQPALTAGRFIPNPYGAPGSRLYRTGDLGCYRLDGQIEFLGRLDNQVKLRGNRIELSEIESVLKSHPDVLQAAVLLHSGENGERLSACVVLQGGRQIDGRTLRGYLSERLPEYMLPADFCFLESLPQLQFGKSKRQALLKLDFQTYNRPARYIPPRTALERVLAEIFAQILNREKVGVMDDFFALGGHSLLVMRLMAQINDIFQCELSLVTLFEYPTVEMLAAFMLKDEQERQRIEMTAQFLLGLDANPDE